MKPISRIVKQTALEQAMNFLTAIKGWTFSPLQDSNHYFCKLHGVVQHIYSPDVIIKMAELESFISDRLPDFSPKFKKYKTID